MIEIDENQYCRDCDAAWTGPLSPRCPECGSVQVEVN